ncbi:UbiA prenyltransferase family protein [candidate division WOR-3 bacterium]|nr:UbiA prenyltransferase family protein [candidate division WOR-3 bacterium]
MKGSKFSDYIFLLRPSIMIALWTFYFAGVTLAFRINGLSYFNNNYNAGMIIVTLLMYSLLMGSVYVINQIVDIDTDRLNKKLFILPDGIISKQNAMIYVIMLSVISLSGIMIMPQATFVMKGLLILSFILGVMYSVKPFCLKRRPFVDLIDNVIGYGMIAVIIGFESTGYSFRIEYVQKLLPYIFSMGAIFINTTLMDYEGDKAVNARTTGVFLGYKKASLLSSILMVFAVISAFNSGDKIMIICSIYSLPFFIYNAVKRSKKIIDISVKLTAPMLTVFLSICFPYFFILNIIVLISMKIYYKKRFNIKYPI